MVSLSLSLSRTHSLSSLSFISEEGAIFFVTCASPWSLVRVFRIRRLTHRPSPPPPTPPQTAVKDPARPPLPTPLFFPPIYSWVRKPGNHCMAAVPLQQYAKKNKTNKKVNTRAYALSHSAFRTQQKKLEDSHTSLTHKNDSPPPKKSDPRISYVCRHHPSASRCLLLLLQLHRTRVRKLTSHTHAPSQ